jgi:hypothetical protein
MTTKFVAGLMISAALLVSPVAASAVPASPGSQGKATAQEDASGKASNGAVAEKKICKQLPSSSSRMTKRACHTKDEWKQVEKEAQGY